MLCFEMWSFMFLVVEYESLMVFLFKYLPSSGMVVRCLSISLRKVWPMFCFTSPFHRNIKCFSLLDLKKGFIVSNSILFYLQVRTLMPIFYFGITYSYIEMKEQIGAFIRLLIYFQKYFARSKIWKWCQISIISYSHAFQI